MAQKIVVYGGSFNPPTMAHERLLGAAMNGVGADRGIFVPSNNAYVTKKMSKTDWPGEVLSEKTRSAMLEAICRADDRFEVDEGEYAFSGTSGNSLDTMKRIQEKYPDAETLYFIFGGDKLKAFAKWPTFREFCENYKIIVFLREGTDPEYEIEHTKALLEFKEAFIILPSPAGIEAISSTAVRDAVRDGDDAKARSMLRQEVFDLLRGTPIHKETAITSFRGRYSFLSNFHSAEVTYDGLTYPTSEAAFQSAKCLNKEERIPFTEQKNPVLVKQMGKKVKLRSDWNYVKVGIMEKIVRAKFTAHPDLAEMLVATGNLPIMEGNTWRDTFWGVDAKTGKGENHLGEILMKVRAELQKSKGLPAAEPITADPQPAVAELKPEPAEIPTKTEERKPASPETTGSDFTVGATVHHPTFGNGTITGLKGQGLSCIVDVEFPAVGLKRLGAAWMKKNCKVI